jgi:hypothetical protein
MRLKLQLAFSYREDKTSSNYQVVGRGGFIDIERGKTRIVNKPATRP